MTPDKVNFMLRYGRGTLCVALTQARCKRLQLAPQVSDNTTRFGTNFTVTVDAGPHLGTTTGVSAFDRATTIRHLIAEEAVPEDFVRPGHVNPLIARDGGVLVRGGQTEGSVDLCRLAGLLPGAALIEVLNDDGTMARVPQLVEFCRRHKLKMCTNAALIEYNGRRAGLMTAFDITERKHVEAALIDAKQQAELYLDLMGHDINNMNQIALGYLELAEETRDEKTASVISKALEMLKSSTALISNLRKIQRVKGGAVELERIDLGELLAEVRDEYSAMPGREMDITFHRPAGCAVMANALLKDVFSNIVGNAIKHSAGRLEIIIKVERAGPGDDRCYKVSVEDNGPGIPDDIKENIFSRFVRGKTETRGHGLGLYLVRTLVEGFGGNVRVEDRVTGDYSQGCRFVVLLPAAPG
ncbi:MAG: 3,4-dihydroxy-2-butanone 4-phosphate synthase [Methanocella sp. PtaU1.Bin125]|nr:MAG: 3,4-dihydroxy-2-butanone 4-phosphate synthase [Methanocella sp. PtaU1.Bin125]